MRAGQLLLCLVMCSVQFSSVTQSCPTLCDPMNSSTPGLPVHYQLPEFTQTHVHQVSDTIQPSHPRSSPSSPSPNPSQHQSFPMSQLFMNCSTPGLPVYHQLPEFTQTYIHGVRDPIQPSHPLLLLPQSLPASESFPMSQLFA